MARNRKARREALAESTDQSAQNEQTTGFEYDLERTPLPPEISYFCRAAACPGLPYAASESNPHPFGTCGAIVNHMPRQESEIPPSHEIEIEMVEPAEPAEPPAIGAESASIPGERSPDMPPIGEPSPEPEPPPEPPPEPAIPEDEPPAAANAPTDIELGSLWQTNAGGPEIIEVLHGATPTEVPVRVYQQTGFLDALLPASMFVERHLTRIHEVPPWLSLMWQRAAERASSSLPERPSLPAVLEQSAIAEDEPSLAGVAELALELGIPKRNVERLVDGALRTIAQCVTFKEQVETSPIVAEIGRRLQSAIPRGRLAGLLGLGLENLLDGKLAEVSCEIAEDVAEARAELDRESAQKLREIESIHEQHLAELGKEQASFEKELETRVALLDNSLDFSKAFEAIETELEEVKRNMLTMRKDLAMVAREGVRAKLDVDPPRRGPGRPKGSTKKTIAKQKPKANLPKKRGRGRPRNPVDPRQMRLPERLIPKLNVPKGATTKPAPKPSKLLVDQFMGKDKDAKVRTILGKLGPKQLDRLVAESKRTFPDLRQTNLTAQDKAAFTLWFYARSGR